MDLSGTVAVVTGASRGIGRSIVERYAEEGANVVATARSADQLETLVEAHPESVVAEPADIRRAAEVEAVIHTAIERFGGVDVLVNNAAVGLLSLQSELKPVHRIEPEEWATVLETNLTGAFLCLRYALPSMIERDSGNVANVSSAYGKHGEAGWGPYVSSKHGLEGLTETVALEHADDGINANAITPAGSTNTGFWDTDEKRSHLPPAERDAVQDPDVMDEAAVLLAAQGPDGVSGESMSAPEWEARLR